VAAGVLALLSTARPAAAAPTPTRSPDCARPATEAFRHLSVAQAREILNRQFSQDSTPRAPLSFDGLDYACVTGYREKDLREVAVLGRSGASELRLFVNGDAEATRLEDAINRLILEARRDQAKKKKKAATPAPRATS
jgi:hypothetical protein